MSLTLTPIHQLHQRRLAKEITTSEIAQAVLDRIQATEGELHSFLQQEDPTQVMARAKAADDKLQAGKTLGPLESMPIAVKDIFCIQGRATTCASKYLENFIAPYDSTVTQKLTEAGYNLLGKTNMDEFAMGSSTENSAFGPTKNPYDLTRVPGGSSGGSASAVAAGQALAALGTDTGGSIRQPASFTNIVGLKPTYGRISRWGMVAFASSLDQAGPMTRDVRDAGLLLNALCGYDEKDSTSLKAPVPDFTSDLGKPVKGMKVGVVKDLDLSSCDPDVIKTFENNLAALKDLGVELVDVSLPNLKHGVATYYVIAPSEASSNLGRYDGIRYGLRAAQAENLLEIYEESRDQGLGKEVKLRILLGTFALSAGYYDAYYIKAQQVQNLIRAQYKHAFAKVDAIATPVAPSPAFKLGERVNDPLQMYLSDAFTIPVNLAGVPGISVPGGFCSQGLPIGFQLVADHLQETKLLQLAGQFEQHLKLQSPPLGI